MAVLVLFRGGDFGEGFAYRRKIKDRIVAEARGAARHFQNVAVDARSDDGAGATVLREGDSADKIPLPFRSGFSAQGGEQLGIALGAAVVRSRIASGMHAGRPT